MEDLIRHFGIDWRLLLAQAINFGILLAVLTKFAYRPIMETMKKRREEIERGIVFTKEAEERMARIAELEAERIEAARREALLIVNEARALGRRQKEDIVAEAGRRGEALIAEAKRAIAEEKAKLREELEAQARELVRDGVARVLIKMPPQERDRELVEEAIRAMRSQ